MTDSSIGDILRTKRKEMGYSLDDASDATNIRRRTLEIFETGDYSYFPPDGYARNMILSYARFLELNTEKVLHIYDVQRSEYEEKNTLEFAASNDIERMKRRANSANDRAVKAESNQNAEPENNAHITSSIKIVPRSQRKHSSLRTTRHDANRNAASDINDDSTQKPSTFRTTRKRRKYIAAKELQSGDPNYNASSKSFNSDNLKHNNTSEFSNKASREQNDKKLDIYSTGRLSDITAAMKDADKFKETHNDSFAISDKDESSYGLRKHNHKTKPTNRGNKSHSSKSSSSHHHDFVAQSPIQRFIAMIIAIFKDKRTRLIAIAVLFIILAIVVAASLLISSASNNNGDEVIEVQGGAQGDSTTSTNTDEKGNTTATVTTSNGNPVVIILEVETGKTSLINVNYDDDVAYNGTAVGPWKRQFSVTKSFNASFGTPESVKVTENGNEIPVAKNDDGTGSITINIQAAGLAESSK